MPTDSHKHKNICTTNMTVITLNKDAYKSIKILVWSKNTYKTTITLLSSLLFRITPPSMNIIK